VSDLDVQGNVQGPVNVNGGWSLRSSAGLAQGGEALSLPGIDTTSWHTADLPSTVLGALVDAGHFENLFFGTNLSKLPGQGPAGKNFSNHPMPEDSPFRVSWWFRKELDLEVLAARPAHTSLQLDGINYRANLWLNGEKVAGADQIAGAYRDYEFDVTERLRHDRPNVLAVEVFPPDPCDLAVTWVDWNPSPVDKNMGIWRDVWLRTSGPVALRSPHVISRLEGQDGWRKARLTIATDLLNLTDRPRQAVVRAVFDGRVVSKRFEVPARGRMRAEIGPDDDRLLTVERPRLWWPHTIGEPELYPVDVDVSVDDSRSDHARFDFGIREIKSELTAEGHTQFSINDVPLLIRGAGWASDLFLRRQPERDRAQLQYVKAMGLNTIRFEGMLERGDFLDQCDREGILVIAGWACCDCWEKWETWSAENHVIAPESLRSQLRRVRRHPCLLTWWYGSDFPPPAHVEKRYLEVLAEEHWPNPFQSSATHKPAELTGSSGLKMLGPYDWVPPNYWLEDTKKGGAFGFATEISPGPAVPPIESLRKMIPAQHLWPIDEVWSFHAGIQEFGNIRAFTEALDRRYGPASTVEEFAELSQLATYEGQRAMFEGYARNRSRASGVIQWMLNNAWPSLIWHVYDYFLRPGGGFFGTQKGCEPLHVMYAYDDRSIVVINDHPRDWEGLRVEARVVNLDGKTLNTQTHHVGVGAVSATTVGHIPAPGGERLYFVDLRLFAADGALVSRNFYWLPSKLDVLDDAGANWFYTPVREYADLSALRSLRETRVVLKAARKRAQIDGSRSRADGTEIVEVDVANPTSGLAFFVQLRLADGDGQDVLPVVWTDNYVSLLPGERSTVRATIPRGRSTARSLVVEARGLNVPLQTVRLPAPDDDLIYGHSTSQGEGESHV
jgi:exo-1,4-beta-D-glucosaminidase